MLGGHMLDHVGALGGAELTHQTRGEGLLKVLLQMHLQPGLGLEDLLALGAGLVAVLLGLVFTRYRQ
jgi:hypothetical protein